MPQLADVVCMHGAGYIARFGQRLLPSHARALHAIAHCRTPALGAHLALCSGCQRTHLCFHSCQHRACPRCGHRATARWLHRQQQLLLPVPYFHLVFTLPAELRRPVRQHQRALVTVLFRAAFEALSEMCSDSRWLGGRIGALAVLHTWSRTLSFHPHVHMLVPAGGLGDDGRTWVTPPRRKSRFLVPVRALSARFRGRFMHLARRAVPGLQLPDIPWSKRWVVFAKPVVSDPQRVLRYLGRYVHRTALSDKAVTACTPDSVSFNYRDSRSGVRRHMTLPPHEFLRRVLQHVPPRGMHRVRAFGLLHPRHRHSLRRLQLLLDAPQTPAEQPPPVRVRCPHCGHRRAQLVQPLDELQCRAWLQRHSAAPARAPPVQSSSAA
jgi:hypothetical protein